MQSKGTTGSVISGVIAIFLVLVCLFYLSFSWVTNRYEKKADEYALVLANGNANGEAYKKAYKNYIDSIGKEKVYPVFGYTFNQVQKMGVGLGLDLKGGMNVILQVSVPDILRSIANADDNKTFNRVLAATDSVVKKSKTSDYVAAFFEQYKRIDPSADMAVVFKNVAKRGESASQVESTVKQEVKDRVSSSTNVLRNRIDQFGVVAPNIQELEKDGQILLELPGVKEHDRVRDLLKASANLEFYETYTLDEIQSQLMALENALRNDSTATVNTFFGNFDGSGYAGTPVVGMATQAHREIIDSLIASPTAARILPSNLKLRWEVKPQEVQYTDSVTNAVRKAEIYTLIALKSNNGKPALAGDVVVSATSDFDTMQGNYVSMDMNSDGAKAWARVTQNNLGKPVAIVLDEHVYSYPRINSVIEGGRSQITGNFTVEDAKDLANVLKSGKMAAKVEIVSDTVIGPSLGKQAIHDGFLSFVIALVLLMIFMMMIYGVIPGLIANIGLVCNLFFTMGILASFQAVLTLSGIAGIVLALGMAVDANVLIFERAKEELRAGKKIGQAIADGYSNAFSAIFDSNLTSVITAVILLLYGTGPIKGFATTLIIGIVCSFFTAVFLTRLVFIGFGKTKPFQALTFTTPISKNMLSNTKINFLGQRKGAFMVCGLFVVIVIVSLFARGMNQGIDFSGGRNYIVQFDHPVKTHELQQKLAPLFPDASLSVITIDNDTKVRISTNYKINEETDGVDKEITKLLYDGLQSELGGMSIEDFSTTNENVGIQSSQKVGPTIAADMKSNAYIAVILSLIAMFLYILLRFHNVAFSVGALAAVAFTAFTIIGFYSLFWGFLPFSMEIDQTFIAAILTVIGYQINDTVVVFDRVRENLKLYPSQDFFTIVNQSINTTLSRTIITSGSTLLVLLCIFILGGESIRSFTFAMLFGVITGTLATIYVASPVAYLIDRRRGTSKKAAAKAKK